MIVGKNKLQIEGLPNIQVIRNSVVFKDQIEIVIDEVNLKRALDIIDYEKNKSK